jgi:hypothetical protein
MGGSVSRLGRVRRSGSPPWLRNPRGFPGTDGTTPPASVATTHVKPCDGSPSSHQALPAVRRSPQAGPSAPVRSADHGGSPGAPVAMRRMWLVGAPPGSRKTPPDQTPHRDRTPRADGIAHRSLPAVVHRRPTLLYAALRSESADPIQTVRGSFMSATSAAVPRCPTLLVPKPRHECLRDR